MNHAKLLLFIAGFLGISILFRWGMKSLATVPDKPVVLNQQVEVDLSSRLTIKGWLVRIDRKLDALIEAQERAEHDAPQKGMEGPCGH